MDEYGIIFNISALQSIGDEVDARFKMRQEIFKLNAQIQQEDEIGKKLRASIDALQHDPKTVERLTRSSLMYAKPGETIIRFEEVATNGAGH